jgi:hypothetical protein
MPRLQPNKTSRNQWNQSQGVTPVLQTCSHFGTCPEMAEREISGAKSPRSNRECFNALVLTASVCVGILD